MKKAMGLFIALAVMLFATQVFAATVYPLDKATMLAGAKFDFKVEFDTVVRPQDVQVTINGRNYAEVLGATGSWMEERLADGSSATALIVRDVALANDNYTVRVKTAGGTDRVDWTVFPPSGQAKAKNVIVLIADGLSVGHRTAARLISKGNVEGTSQGVLNMDRMERLGMLGTSSVDAITVDSANSMSAYMTGHKSSINAIGVYADRTEDPFDDPKQENIAELLRRTTGKSIGIVSDAELEDATPAAVVAHTRRRAEKAEIVKAFAAIEPEVLLGGGASYFLPQSVTGSKRKDDIDFIKEFSRKGYAVVTSNTELTSLDKDSMPEKLLGLFHPGNMDGALDRLFLKKNTVPKYPDQPDLTTMTKVALDILSRNDEGFFLMVEAGSVDKFAHPMDWERSVYDTIMFDQVVGIAQQFMKSNPDTLLIVTGDHTHSISVYGTVDDEKEVVASIRDKVGTYANAGFPNYADKNGDGYPDDVYPTKRLAVGFGNHPDYYESFAPHLEGTFTPAVKDENGRYVANEAYDKDGALFMQGNLSYDESQEVHSVDDQILSMSGPGSEQVKAYQENTATFRYIVEAFGIDPRS
ncbi:MAG: alkaline phosphatase [Sphaerochaetaceae bacterium]